MPPLELHQLDKETSSARNTAPPSLFGDLVKPLAANLPPALKSSQEPDLALRHKPDLITAILAQLTSLLHCDPTDPARLQSQLHSEFSAGYGEYYGASYPNLSSALAPAD